MLSQDTCQRKQAFGEILEQIIGLHFDEACAGVLTADCKDGAALDRYTALLKRILIHKMGASSNPKCKPGSHLELLPVYNTTNSYRCNEAKAQFLILYRTNEK
jgi:hypothetical protein